jgi:microsomal dipeptidase-like Zn-dependent dipeptidase
MAEGGLDAVHVTICYHENFQETIQNIETWNRHFRDYSHRIVQGRCADDVLRAKIDGKTAIFFGLQNCTSIEGVLDRIEICYQLGVRFMQLSYNNQSLLATGCYENEDTGVTRMGRQVIREMNRVGLVIDMSHSAERSTLEAIEYSTRPIAITHANSASWHPVLRNKSDEVLKALASSGGMIGFSLYPHHLKDNSECTLDSFCEMVSDVAEKIGIDHIGVGSDLCQDQPDSVVSWMRNGSWTRDVDYGEGSENTPGFPDSPIWFGDNRDFPNLTQGLLNIGFSESDVGQIMGGNWLEFFRRSFGEDEQK